MKKRQRKKHHRGEFLVLGVEMVYEEDFTDEIDKVALYDYLIKLADYCKFIEVNMIAGLDEDKLTFWFWKNKTINRGKGISTFGKDELLRLTAHLTGVGNFEKISSFKTFDCYHEGSPVVLTKRFAELRLGRRCM